MAENPVIETLREAARSLRGGVSDLDALRAIQTAQDALDAAKAEIIGRVEESREYESEGASSVRAWARRELRLSARDARALVGAAHTLRTLPPLAETARAGGVRLAHVQQFTYGLRHVGASRIITAHDWLLPVAQTCEPGELHGVVRALREAVHPEELDAAWARGMDREDLQVTPVVTGWHVSGFLPADLGGKLRAVLDSLGAPRAGGDTRTGSQRRIDALDELVDTVLAHGLPSDRGVRPHLSLHLDVAALRDWRSGGQPPAQLSGFGTIGPQLLEYLMCSSEVTAFLSRQHVAGHSDILDLGRTRRLASRAQRRAVLARQRDVCAAPGCGATHLEIHHARWWSHGGPTDLDNLIGLCPRCHRLVHRGLLTITAHGQGRFAFHDHDTRPIRPAWRARVAQRRRQRGDPAPAP